MTGDPTDNLTAGEMPRESEWRAWSSEHDRLAGGSVNPAVTARFADGTVVTRRTSRPVRYASRRGHGMPVTFHRDYLAARRAVSKYSGEIVKVEKAR